MPGSDVVSDSDAIAKLRAESGWRCDGGCADQQHPLDYRFADVRVGVGVVDFAVEQRNGLHARIVLPLPSSGAPQPWLYAEPESADDWMQQLLIWMDEEIDTRGLTDSRAREVVHGESYVIVAPYGWQVSDPAEHGRLMAASERWNR